MSIRDAIEQYGETGKRPSKVDVWLENATFDVEEFTQVALDGNIPISWIANWAIDNGFDGSDTTMRKWVQKCRSEMK